MAFTESVRSFQVPATPGTTAWPPSLPSVPTSRATRVTSDANDRSWSTIVLMASFSCRISPRTSTVIFLERSPLATAIVTSAMLRTCAVRLPAIWFTDSVRSFHTPDTPFTCAWPPSLPSVPTSRATRVTSEVNTESWSIMRVDQLRRAQELAFERPAVDLEAHRLRQVALGHRADRAGHFGGRPHQVVDQRVDGGDFVRPRAPAPDTAMRSFTLPSLPHHAGHPRHVAGAAVAQGDDSLKASAICRRARSDRRAGEHRSFRHGTRSSPPAAGARTDRDR